MLYDEGIKHGIQNQLPDTAIARKIYLSYPTFVFKENPELEFKLINDVSVYFRLPFKSVQIVGSSKTGFSYFKKTNYVVGESDLDIAIIDQALFLEYTEAVFKMTKGLSDLSKFGRTKDGDSNFKFYSSQILKGFFRPDLMPSSEIKKTWFNFFNKLSQDYIEIFSDINAGIYLNEHYFEVKQSKILDWFKKL